MSAANIRTLMEAASTALETDGYTVARRKAQAAYALMVSMPNSARAGASLGWDRAAIKAFIEDVTVLEREAASGAGACVDIPLEYERGGV